MPTYRVEIYQGRRGRKPFVDWITGLRDHRARAAIDQRLRRLVLGNLGDHKKVGQDVWEFRVALGPGYRVYFGRVGRRVILLLCGGDKGSQRRDIVRARTYWADYLERP